MLPPSLPSPLRRDPCLSMCLPICRRSQPRLRSVRRRIAVFATTGAIALIVALTILLLRDPAERDPAEHAPIASAPTPPAIGTLAVRHFRPVAVDDERGLLGETVTALLEQRFAGIVGLPVIAAPVDPGRH